MSRMSYSDSERSDQDRATLYAELSALRVELDEMAKQVADLQAKAAERLIAYCVCTAFLQEVVDNGLSAPLEVLIEAALSAKGE